MDAAGTATDCLRLCLHTSQRSKRRRVSCAASSAAFTPAGIPSEPGRSSTPAADEESFESGLSDALVTEGAREQGGMAAPAVARPDRLTGAIALIAGGTIGAGIIALPVKTVAAGFVPSTVALTCCWAYMTLTACLIIELTTVFGAGTNVVTMAENTLGKAGKALTLVLYTFIYCATLTAYIAEGAKLMAPAFAALGLAAVPSWLACGAFTSVFGGFVYAGTEPAEKLNSVCLVVAIAAYATLVGFGMGGVDFGNLLRANWGATVAPLPIMVVAFTFHNMIPSLMSYLGCRKLLLKAIVWGSIIPLVFYTLWQGVIMGTIGSAAASLTSADQIVAALRASAGASAEVAIRVFSFFAIVTSFLGIALGYVDFMQGYSDALCRPPVSPFSGFISIFHHTTPHLTESVCSASSRPAGVGGFWLKPLKSKKKRRKTHATSVSHSCFVSRTVVDDATKKKTSRRTCLYQKL